MLTQVHELHDLLAAEEVFQLSRYLKQGNWILHGYATNPESKVFWKKNILHTPAKYLFLNIIQKLINNPVEINELYVNGQAHGQCGNWHMDQQPDTPEIRNDGTLVYFPNEWQPIFGGHLMIDTGDIISILPEYNKGVLFNSSFLHVGLEPTCYCKDQRESIACKFTIKK